MVSLHDQWNPDFVDSPGEKKIVQIIITVITLKYYIVVQGKGSLPWFWLSIKLKKITGLKPGILAVAYMTFNCRDMAPILRTLVQVINLSDKIKFWAFLCLKFSPFFPLKIWTF